jgi:integrase
MIDRRLPTVEPAASPHSAAGQTPNGCCRTRAPLDPENFSRTFAKLYNRAGLGHWHPHELRHLAASLILAQGTPLQSPAALHRIPDATRPDYRDLILIRQTERMR